MKTLEKELIEFLKYVQEVHTDKYGHLDVCECYAKSKQEYEYIGECRGNNGKGCFMDSCGHDCGCYVRIPKQESTNPTLPIADVNKRFFFFTYAYWCDKSEGKGTLSLSPTFERVVKEYIKSKKINIMKKFFHKR